MSDKKEEILSVASKLMEKRGYHATGLSEILKKSGAPKGSLYHYFPGGKGELAIEVIKRNRKQISKNIQFAMDQYEDPAIAVPAFIKELAKVIEEAGYIAGGPLTAIATETAATDHSISSACADTYKDWIALIKTKLAESDRLRATSSRDAQVIISSLEGAILLARTLKSKEPLHNLSDFLSKSLAI